MPERQWNNGNGYRYGFNGKENDNEVKGIEGSQQDYGMRIYDPRIGRFLSVDPLTRSYPWYTPYQFAGNMPIWAVDLDGAEEMIVADNLKENGEFQTILGLLNHSKILNSLFKQFTAQNNYVLVYTGFEAKRTYGSGVQTAPSWQGSTVVVSSKDDWKKDYVAYHINYSEIESYINAKKKVIIVGLANHTLNYGGETSLENNSLDAIESERDALWNLIHELVAHVQRILNGITSTGADDHAEFQGDRSNSSPDFYDLLNKDEYKDTKAGKLAKKLIDYYDEELFPLITKTSEEHRKAAKEAEKKPNDKTNKTANKKN